MSFRLRPSTAALFRFLEGAAEVRPVEALGRVADLAEIPGEAMPTIVQTDRANENKLTSRGRAFGTDLALTGLDQVVAGVTDHTRLVRDVTIRAFIDWKIENQLNGNTGVVCVRGKSITGSDPERQLYGLELERIDANNLRMRARWQDRTGNQAVLAGAAFLKPAGFFHVAVTRRWNTTSDVLVRYYVNDQLIGSETIVNTNDIGEGFGGTLIIGARNSSNPAVGFTAFMPIDSVIDHISIEADEMSAEELRTDYRRQALHFVEGGALLRAYIPPGDTWNPNPDSLVQRWIAAEGDAIGDGLAEANRLRDDFLPDRAYGAALARWESITGLAPGPSDSIGVRRERVLGFLRKILGFSVPDIKTSLEPLFGLDAVDIEIVEYDALRTDDFGTDDIAAPPSRIWITTPAAGAIGIAAGVCSVALGAAPVPGQWFQGPFAPHRKASLSALKEQEPNRSILITELSSIVTADGTALIGHLWMTANKDVIWLGVRQVGGVRELASFTVIGGVVSGFTTLLTPFATDPFFLFTSYLGNGLFNFKTAIVAAGPYSADVAIPGPSGIRWCGFGAVHQDAAGSAISADFDDAQIYEPEGLRGLAWQAFRDPGLPGEFSVENAQLQLDKQRPAHTEACAVIEKPQGFELGPTGLGKLGCDPLFPADQIIS